MITYQTANTDEKTHNKMSEELLLDKKESNDSTHK